MTNPQLLAAFPPPILVVAAHPDDETIMCGGLLRAMRDETTMVLTLTDGVSSRPGTGSECIVRRAEHAKSAMLEVLRVDRWQALNYKDQMLDAIPIMMIANKVAECMTKYKPNCVITHDVEDINLDHVRTNQAVRVACRPHKYDGVLYSAGTDDFDTTLLLGTDSRRAKAEAWRCYKDECEHLPHIEELMQGKYECYKTIQRLINLEKQLL